MTTYILFILGFAILILGAKWLVDGAASIGKRFGLSQLLIGLTLVAVGTSLPELVINVFASIEGNTDLAIGNVLGSNIMNSLLIIGAAALIYPIHVSRQTINKDLIFNLGVVLLLFVLANDRFFERPDVINRLDGFILLGLLCYFLYLSFFKSAKGEIEPEDEIKPIGLWASIGFILLGMTGLFFGGKWIVAGAEQVAGDLGFSQSLIGMTLVAAATSLPELVTSVIASFRKNSAIAIGNAIGSNIFNVLLVLGLSAVIHPIPFDPGVNMELGILGSSGLLLFLFIRTGKTKRTISRWEGGLLVMGYIAFLYYSIYYQ